MAVDVESTLFDANINPPVSHMRGVAPSASILRAAGDGHLAGESPDGVTRVDGVPESAQVRVLHRATGEVIAVVDSAQDGTWQVGRLNPRLRFDVVGRRAGFNDVIVADVSPFTSAQLDGPARVQAHVGVPFQYEVKMFGGTGAATIALVGGTLPSGITYSDGVLSGMWPTGTTGDYPLTFDITDGGVTTQAVLTIALALRPLRFDLTRLPRAFEQDVEIDPIQLVATGGEAPYSFAVVDGVLPDGLSLSPSGMLSGEPDTLGAYTFSIAATDARSASLVREAIVTTYEPGTIPISGLRILITANNGNAYAAQIDRMKILDAHGVDLTGNGVAAAASSYTTNRSENAFDDAGNYWLAKPSSSTPYPTWIEYKFPEPVGAYEVSIMGTVPTRMPKDFAIQTCIGAEPWRDAVVVTGSTGWGNGVARSWVIA